MTPPLARAALFTLFVTALALTFAIAPPATVAQDQLIYNPACPQVLAFSPANWSDEFTKKNRDPSEAGQDRAALRWAGCKQESNLKALQGSQKRKIRLLKLNRLEAEFIAYETDLTYRAQGGGTMYRHGQIRFQTDLAVHLERLIALTAVRAGAVQSSSLTARYRTAKTKLEARVKRVQTPKPFTAGMGKSEIAEVNGQWLKVARNYAATARGIAAVIGPRIDTVSVLEMEFLAAGLWAENL